MINRLLVDNCFFYQLMDLFSVPFLLTLADSPSCADHDVCAIPTYGDGRFLDRQGWEKSGVGCVREKILTGYRWGQYPSSWCFLLSSVSNWSWVWSVVRYWPYLKATSVISTFGNRYCFGCQRFCLCNSKEILFYLPSISPQSLCSAWNGCFRSSSDFGNFTLICCSVWCLWDSLWLSSGWFVLEGGYQKVLGSIVA